LLDPLLQLLAHSWLAECVGLFVGTFVQEDVAVVAGGMLVVEYHFPIALAIMSLYAGVVISDFFIYGLGMAARRLPWAQRLLINDKVERIRDTLERHIIPSVAICRFLPGLLFPTFLACGWTGVSFSRFVVVTMVAAAVYTPLLLILVVTLGQTVLTHIGYAGWILMLCLALAAAVYGSMRPAWRTFVRVIARRPEPAAGNAAIEAPCIPGMPPLSALSRRVSLAERIPPLLFYVPIVVRWFLLGIRYRSFTLPTVANPMIEAGGLWGESKSDLMGQVGGELRRWIAPFATLRRTGAGAETQADLQSATAALAQAGLSFPVVVKPDIGWQGYGVRVVGSPAELRDYLEVFPVGENVILQEPVDYDGEAGVFYIRIPGEERGRIASVTLRYYPHVIGDGTSTVRELIARDGRTSFKAGHILGAKTQHMGLHTENLDAVPAHGQIVRLSFIGSLRVGGLYRDARRYITPAMSERFEAIAGSMPEFYFGRFDIRFKSIERLQEGEDFRIIEINGAGSEAVHIWDPETSLIDVYRELFLYQSMLFEISDRNRANGHSPMTVRNFVEFTRGYSRLLGQYPPSR
jgi:membrane protein DedA with SNARE-associated domain